MLLESQRGGGASTWEGGNGGTGSKLEFEKAKNVEEGSGYGQPLSFDTHLRAKFSKLAKAVSTCHVGGNVGFAAGVTHEVYNRSRVGGFKLEVKPLHLWVAGTVVINNVDRGGGVGEHPSDATERDVGEDVKATDHAEQLKLGDGVPKKTGRDVQREEMAVTPSAKAGRGSSFFGCIG
jgi:hypothetical protein